MSDLSQSARPVADIEQAKAEVVEWDEFGQGYNAKAECVVCICGVPYPHRWDHYCPADSYDHDAEFQW